LLLLCAPACWAGEGPFFITYTHQMEEPGNLEIATKNVTGRPALALDSLALPRNSNVA